MNYPTAENRSGVGLDEADVLEGDDHMSSLIYIYIYLIDWGV